MLLATAWARAFLLGASVLLFGCGQGAGSESIESAQRYFDKKDFPAAVVALKSVLVKDPASARARYLLGAALLEQGQAAQALTELNKSLELGYDEDPLLAKRATALLANGRTQELLRDYGAASLTDKVSQAELQTAVAVAHIRANQIAQAESALAEALSADSAFGWALTVKARIAIHRGEVDAAMKYIDAAIASGTVNGEAWHMKGALLQVGRGDLAGAEQAYLESAKDKRYAATAHTALVTLFLVQNRRDDLRALYERMKKSSPNHPTTTLVEAQIAYLEGNIGKSREGLDRLLRAAPNDARLLLFSGAVDLARGALLAAETQLGKAIQVTDGLPVARRMLAETYLRMGQPEKSLVALRPLLESGQADGDALAMAADAHLQLGNVQQAEELFASAVKYKPDDIKLRTAMALTDLARGRAKDGLEELQKLSAAESGDVAAKALISSLMRRKDYAAALAAVNRLQQKLPDNASVIFHRGLVLRAMEDASGARHAFEATLKAEPLHFLATANLADLDLKAGDPVAARQRLNAAVEANPRDVAPRLTLLSMMRSAGAKPDELRAVLDAAIAALPAEPALRVALVDHLLSQRDAKAGLAAAQQASVAFRDHPGVLDALGRAQSDAGDDEQAISTFNRLASLSPRNAMPHLRLADVHGKRKNMSAAAASLRRAFELAPENDGIHRRMLSLGAQTKDYSLALAAAKSLQRSHPQLVAGYFIEGDVEAARKNWPAAIAAFRAAVGKPAAGSWPQIRVHDATLASGQVSGAARFATEWIKSHPEDGGFIEHLAQIALRRGDNGEAERLLKLAVEANPRSALAYNNLAWVQAERGDAEAVANAEKALRLLPGSPPVLDTLAKALASQRQFTRAIEVQRQALVAGKDLGLYRLHLARIHLAAGDKTSALAELDRIVAMGEQFSGQAAVADLRRSIQSK